MRMTRIDEEYLTHSIEDDDEMMLVKKAISQLSPVQRKIYLTYVDSGTYTATAKEFNVSVPTAKSYVDNINSIIIKYIFENI